jgi:hypothetical protein
MVGERGSRSEQASSSLPKFQAVPSTVRHCRQLLRRVQQVKSELFEPLTKTKMAKMAKKRYRFIAQIWRYWEL